MGAFPLPLLEFSSVTDFDADFKTVADNASSLGTIRGSTGDGKNKDDGTVLSSEVGKTEFEFDAEVINTTAYRRAFAAAQRRRVTKENVPLVFRGTKKTRCRTDLYPWPDDWWLGSVWQGQACVETRWHIRLLPDNLF